MTYIHILFKEHTVFAYKISYWPKIAKIQKKQPFKIKIQSEVMIRRDVDLLSLKRDTKKEVAVYLVSGKITKSWVLFVQLSDQSRACYCHWTGIVFFVHQQSLHSRCCLELLRNFTVEGALLSSQTNSTNISS